MCMQYARMVTSVWAGKMWNSWRSTVHHLFPLPTSNPYRIYSDPRVHSACMCGTHSWAEFEPKYPFDKCGLWPHHHHTTNLFCTWTASHRNCGEICVSCAQSNEDAHARFRCFLVFILFSIFFPTHLEQGPSWCVHAVWCHSRSQLTPHALEVTPFVRILSTPAFVGTYVRYVSLQMKWPNRV